MIEPTCSPRASRWTSAALTLGLLLLVGIGPVAASHGGDDGGGRGGGRGGGGGGDKTLKLRVNEAIGKPGGTIAVVLRTYAARPIRQGQISVRTRRGAPPAKLLNLAALTAPVRPFLRLVSAVVYSPRQDTRSEATLAGAADGQAVAVSFSSPSETINSADGPLAVFKFILDPAAQVGDRYTLEVDGALTALVAAGGGALALQPISGTLTVRAPGAPFAIEAEGDEVAPGGVAELGINTFEPFPSAGGRITLRYPAGLAAGAPTVRIDPRYGRATFTVNSATPGKLVVDIQSPDASFNDVPGRIVAVALPIKASAQVGAAGAVTLDPAGTYLLTQRGRKVKLAIENGSLTIR